MTRETKAGLVVSCSFVCLVAIVIFAKMREKSPSPTATDQVELSSAPNDPTPLDEKRMPEPSEIDKGAKRTENDRGLAQQPGLVAPVKPAVKELEKSQPGLTKNATPQEFVLPSATSIPAAVASKSTKDETSQIMTKNTSPPITPTPQFTTPSTKPDLLSTRTPALNSPAKFPATQDAARTTRGTDIATFPSAANGNSPPLALNPLTTANPATTPAKDTTKDSGVGTFNLPGRDQASNGIVNNGSPKPDGIQSPWALPEPPPAVTPPPTVQALDKTLAANNPGQASQQNDPFALRQASTPGGQANTTPNQPLSLQPDTKAPQLSTIPAATAKSSQGNGIALQPALTQQRPAGQERLPPLAAANLDRNAENLNGQDVRLGTPLVTTPPANQLVQGTSTNSPSPTQRDVSPGRTEQPPMLPLRSAPTPVIVPAVAPASSEPGDITQAVSYDVQPHICQPNDTFRSISQAYFQSDKYERALLAFNRNYPVIDEAVRQSLPALREGQKLFIPPARILEKYYSSLIGDAASAGQTAQQPSLAPVPANESAGKGYRVRANGEGFYEIARRTLGSGDRWPEIYRLNQRYDPKNAVPGGTELRLPADARVDPADVP
jgi:hypothetical protein